MESQPCSYKFISEVKEDVKARIISDDKLSTFEHVKTLIKQGKILELSFLEQNDATWKSFIYNLPRGTMKWLLNANLDTLPTKANLKQWGKRTNDSCFCGQKQTLNHILSCCNRALHDGRYTYRHDNILSYILSCLDQDKYKVYVDIEGSRTTPGGTLPPDVLVSNLKPDIVVLDKKKKEVHIFELTVPNEQRIETSNQLKFKKYKHFLTDIKTYKPSLTPFEVGAQTGYISKENRKNISNIHKFCKTSIKLKNFLNNVSAISVLSSYYIFNCRDSESWDLVSTIPPPFPNQ